MSARRSSWLSLIAAMALLAIVTPAPPAGAEAPEPAPKGAHARTAKKARKHAPAADSGKAAPAADSSKAGPGADGDNATPAADGSSKADPAAADEAPAAAAEEPPPAALPEGHQPELTLEVEPRDGVKTGQIVQVEVGALAPVGDDITIPDQSFGHFEVHKKLARAEPPQDGKQRFVFKLELLALEPGDGPIPAVELRVVTKDNFVGTVKTAETPYRVRSLIANEPNAQPKGETKPVAVLEDNWLPIYIAGGLLGAAVIAALTLLGARWWRERKRAAIPPPPPRPPWEIAVEKLAELRRQKQAMLEAGQGGQFVDQLSDVVRAYLGARYSFDGLETTSDEMLMQLRAHGASLGFTQEVGQFLGRCDLVKFAKVEPDEDEVDLLFAKAQDLVHFSEPSSGVNPPGRASQTPGSPTPQPAVPRQAGGGSR
jgi:hypothetical protein